MIVIGLSTAGEPPARAMRGRWTIWRAETWTTCDRRTARAGRKTARAHPLTNRAASRTRAHPATTDGTAARVGPDAPERYINRELSWLDFNQRVVEEADNPRNPLLERLRFLSISAGNLDEFYSVRVAGLMVQVREALSTRSPDGRTPAQQLVAVEDRARILLAEQQRIWTELCAALHGAGISVLDAAAWTTATAPGSTPASWSGSSRS